MVKKNWWTIVTATLSYQKDLGSHIELERRPTWAVLAEQVGENLCSSVTGHLFCCNQPEWTWNLRWGPLDEDGWTPRSLGHYMSTFGSWMSMGFGAHKVGTRIAAIPVTVEWVKTHYPDAGWPWDGSSALDLEEEVNDGLTES